MQLFLKFYFHPHVAVLIHRVRQCVWVSFEEGGAILNGREEIHAGRLRERDREHRTGSTSQLPIQDPVIVTFPLSPVQKHNKISFHWVIVLKRMKRNE